MRIRGYLEVQSIDTSYDGAWSLGFGDGSTSKTLTYNEAGAVWQASYNNTASTSVFTHQDDQYEEEFFDDAFVVTAETTAAVDTTNNKVTF